MDDDLGSMLERSFGVSYLSKSKKISGIFLVLKDVKIVLSLRANNQEKRMQINQANTAAYETGKVTYLSQLKIAPVSI